MVSRSEGWTVGLYNTIGGDADDDSNSSDEGTYPTFPSLSSFSTHSAHYTALNLATPAITLSKLLTPASLVHSVTISLSVSSLISAYCFFNPFIPICLGTKNLFAIATFSSNVYPARCTISHRSSSGEDSVE